MIEANGLFEVWRPDEVAECLHGVPNELYEKLWDFTLLYPEAPSECNDNFSELCLLRFWDKLTEAEQELLNSLAATEMEKIDITV